MLQNRAVSDVHRPGNLLGRLFLLKQFQHFPFLVGEKRLFHEDSTGQHVARLDSSSRLDRCLDVKLLAVFWPGDVEPETLDRLWLSLADHVHPCVFQNCVTAAHLTAQIPQAETSCKQLGLGINDDGSIVQHDHNLNDVLWHWFTIGTSFANGNRKGGTIRSTSVSNDQRKSTFFDVHKLPRAQGKNVNRRLKILDQTCLIAIYFGDFGPTPLEIAYMTTIVEQNAACSVGDVISFDYPKSNRLNNKQPHFKSWTICVTAIRDVRRKRLCPTTISKNPMTNRGRWLVTGYCMESNVERSFYWEAMRGREVQTWLTLGLFDPCSPSNDPIKTYGKFAPTVNDRRFMARQISWFNEAFSNESNVVLNLCVFPVDE